MSAVLLAAGSSALYPMLVALVVDRVPARERGVAIGTVSGAWDLGVQPDELALQAQERWEDPILPAGTMLAFRLTANPQCKFYGDDVGARSGGA